MSRPGHITGANTIFAGNLSYDTTEESLTQVLSSVGPIKSLRLVTDRDTGRAKGFAFCEYHDRPSAESAMRQLNGMEVLGRRLRLSYADDRAAHEGPGGGGRGRGGRGGRGAPGGRGGPGGVAPEEPSFDYYERMHQDQQQAPHHMSGPQGMGMGGHHQADMQMGPGDMDLQMGALQGGGMLQQPHGMMGPGAMQEPPMQQGLPGQHMAPMQQLEPAGVIGADAAQQAQQTMSGMVGGPMGGEGQGELTDKLAKMSRQQVWDLMSQMKALIQANEQEARAILVGNPSLTRALFQAQIVLGMVKDRLGGGGAAGQPQHGAEPRPGAAAPQYPLQNGGFPGSQGLPGPGPQGALQPPPHQQAPPVDPRMQQDPRMQHDPLRGAGPAPVDPRMQQQAPPQAAAVDPRQQPAADPRRAHQEPVPVQQQQQPAPAAAPVIDPAQKSADEALRCVCIVPYCDPALIRRIMDLTPQQVEALPADQKAQVIALQNQVRANPSMLA